MLIAFMANGTVLPSYAQLPQDTPQAGGFLNLSRPCTPPLLKGLKVYPQDPLHLDFIFDKGDEGSSETSRATAPHNDIKRLINYFLAAVTVPEHDLWVNLSPYEKDRITPDAFGRTQMGRDLLSQDYILKKLTASLLYPENDLGKEFWAKVYGLMQEKYGTTDIPVDTFNKVWIVPEKATVYEARTAAYVVESRLKVMLDIDYTAQQNAVESQTSAASTNDVTQPILREIIIPALEKEVNEGSHFAQLRQVYNSLILAVWYKDKVRATLLGKTYVEQAKIEGTAVVDQSEKEKIWQRYVSVFKKGMEGYIKEDTDPLTHQTVARKYVSGGASMDQISRVFKTTSDAAMIMGIGPEGLFVIETDLDLDGFEEEREVDLEGYLRYLNNDPHSIGQMMSIVSSSEGKVFLELGAGDGNVSLAIARKNPQLNMIVTDEWSRDYFGPYDRYRQSFDGKALSIQQEIAHGKLNNTTVVRAPLDIVHWLPSASLDYILLNHPTIGMLEELAEGVRRGLFLSQMKPGGQIYIRTSLDEEMEDVVDIVREDFLGAVDVYVRGEARVLGVDIESGSKWNTDDDLLYVLEVNNTNQNMDDPGALSGRNGIDSAMAAERWPEVTEKLYALADRTDLEYGLQGSVMPRVMKPLAQALYTWFLQEGFAEADAKRLSETLARMKRGSLEILFLTGVITGQERDVLSAKDADGFRAFPLIQKKDFSARISRVMHSYDSLTRAQRQAMMIRLVPMEWVNAMSLEQGIARAFMFDIVRVHPDFPVWVSLAKHVVERIKGRIGGSANAWRFVIIGGVHDVDQRIDLLQKIVTDVTDVFKSPADAWRFVCMHIVSPFRAGEDPLTLSRRVEAIKKQAMLLRARALEIQDKVGGYDLALDIVIANNRVSDAWVEKFSAKVQGLVAEVGSLTNARRILISQGMDDVDAWMQQARVLADAALGQDASRADVWKRLSFEGLKADLSDLRPAREAALSSSDNAMDQGRIDTLKIFFEDQKKELLRAMGPELPSSRFGPLGYFYGQMRSALEPYAADQSVPARVLCEIWSQAMEFFLQQASVHIGLDPERVALMAVGSLGRSEMTLGSDVDFLVIPRLEKDADYARDIYDRMQFFLHQTGVAQDSHIREMGLFVIPQELQDLLNSDKREEIWRDGEFLGAIMVPRSIEKNLFMDARFIAGHAPTAEAVLQAVEPIISDRALEQAHRKDIESVQKVYSRDDLKSFALKRHLLQPLVSFIWAERIKYGISEKDLFKAVDMLGEKGGLSPDEEKFLQEILDFGLRARNIIAVEGAWHNDWLNAPVQELLVKALQLPSGQALQDRVMSLVHGMDKLFDAVSGEKLFFARRSVPVFIKSEHPELDDQGLKESADQYARRDPKELSERMRSLLQQKAVLESPAARVPGETLIDFWRRPDILFPDQRKIEVLGQIYLVAQEEKDAAMGTTLLDRPRPVLSREDLDDIALMMDPDYLDSLGELSREELFLLMESPFSETQDWLASHIAGETIERSTDDYMQLYRLSRDFGLKRNIVHRILASADPEKKEKIMQLAGEAEARIMAVRQQRYAWLETHTGIKRNDVWLTSFDVSNEYRSFIHQRNTLRQEVSFLRASVAEMRHFPYGSYLDPTQTRIQDFDATDVAHRDFVPRLRENIAKVNISDFGSGDDVFENYDRETTYYYEKELHEFDPMHDPSDMVFYRNKTVLKLRKLATFRHRMTGRLFFVSEYDPEMMFPMYAGYLFFRLLGLPVRNTLIVKDHEGRPWLFRETIPTHARLDEADALYGQRYMFNPAWSRILRASLLADEVLGYTDRDGSNLGVTISKDGEYIPAFHDHKFSLGLPKLTFPHIPLKDQITYDFSRYVTAHPSREKAGEKGSVLPEDFAYNEFHAHATYEDLAWMASYINQVTDKQIEDILARADALVPGHNFDVPRVLAEWKRSLAKVRELYPDAAQGNSDDLQKGGIDLARNKLPLEVKEAGAPITFTFSPELEARLQEAKGMVPVIIRTTPMTRSVFDFLAR